MGKLKIGWMELLKVLVEAFIVDLLCISFSQNIIYIIIFVKKKLYIFKLNDLKNFIPLNFDNIIRNKFIVIKFLIYIFIHLNRVLVVIWIFIKINYLIYFYFKIGWNNLFGYQIINPRINFW